MSALLIIRSQVCQLFTFSTFSGEGIFESFFARRGDFDCRLGRKRLRPNICFPLPRFTHAPYGLERSGNHGGQREQAKAGWISLFCLQVSFVFAYFWSIEFKIVWYQSKQKSRATKLTFASTIDQCMLIRYNLCKLIKLSFFVPFTTNG